MCSNPFKLGEKVESDFEVEEATTRIVCGGNLKLELKWREEYCGYEVLTLDEILEQVKTSRPSLRTPFIEVRYESGLWGVIFQVGNYGDLGDTWLVHGITNGYA